MELGEEFPDVRVVERLNGGSRAGENERAAELCEKYGYLGIGCSDAHLASHICACVTRFEAEIRNEADLVEGAAFRRIPSGLVGGHPGSRSGLETGPKSFPLFTALSRWGAWQIHGNGLGL